MANHRGYTVIRDPQWRTADLMAYASAGNKVGTLITALSGAAEAIATLLLELPPEKREQLRSDQYLQKRINGVKTAIAWA